MDKVIVLLLLRESKLGLQSRLAIRYAVTGDLRFISHHDTLRLFERALSRAEAPVRFSDGFNPRPRMSVVLPRNIGIASSDELLVIDVIEPCDAEAVFRRLSETMPAGLTLLAAVKPPPGSKLLPRRAWYEADIAHEVENALRDRAERLLAQSSLPIERRSPKAPAGRTVDVRPFVERIEVSDGRLGWSQWITATGTIRPDEMLDLLELPRAEYLHRLHRTRVEYGD